jgi:prophage maintenance system killer protein
LDVATLTRNMFNDSLLYIGREIMRRLQIILTLLLISFSLSSQQPIHRAWTGNMDTLTGYPTGAQTFYIGVRYYAPNLGADTMKFTSVQPATLDQVSITFQTLAVTDTVYLDWGDGSAVVKISSITDQIVTSNYATNNTTYNIKLYGDLSKVKKFYVYESTVASLNINDISDYMTNLEYLYLRLITATGNKALPTNITYLYLNGANINWTYSGALPNGITYLYLNGDNINWTYVGALPTDITYLVLNGANINWTYVGALPTGINGYLYLSGANINWTYTGALPAGITYLYLNGANINWTYTGALPAGITYLYLNGDNINWTYTGALPAGITYLRLSGANINWTGLDIGNNGNITNISLINYRIEKMSSEDMVTLLTQMKNRTGTLPETVTINDYADYALPPQAVNDAIAALKTAKSITTVTLGQ